MKNTLQEMYNKIEKTIYKYQDLLKINEIDTNTNKERLVQIPKSMLITDENIFVRETVLAKLLSVNATLQNKNKNLRLIVMEGYRSLEKQQKQFEVVLKQLKTEKSNLEEIELYEIAHKMIAVPEVSGHPTGGAVDVCIYNLKTKRILNFGTQWKDFSVGKKNYTMSPEIKGQGFKNRKLLKKLMEKQNFYQYPCEWWHFSYGDKEWALAKNKAKALYQQTELETQ